MPSRTLAPNVAMGRPRPYIRTMRPHLVFAATLAALILTPPAGRADPDPQLVASVSAGLDRHGLHPDLSRFDTPTVVQLYFALQDRQGWMKTRRELNHILRTAPLKD